MVWGHTLSVIFDVVEREAEGEMLHLNDSLVESELSASSVMVILCNLQIGEREGFYSFHLSIV